MRHMLSKTLIEIGKKPKENPKKYLIKSFPKMLPPLPIRKIKIININFTFKDFIAQLKLNA